MAYNTKKLLTDRNGDPIPQSYDSDGDRYVPSEIDTRLKAIENQQQEILERLDKPIDTQLTGSNVEDGLPVKFVGDKVVEKQLLDRKVRSEFTQAFDLNVDPRVKQVIIQLNVYGVTGNFSEGKGYKVTVRKHVRNDTTQAYDVATSEYATKTGNNSGVLFTIDPTFVNKSFNSLDQYQLVQDTLFPSYRLMLSIKGTFEEGEGVDCDANAYYIY